MVLTGRTKSENLGGTPSISAAGEWDVQDWTDLDGYLVPRRVAHIIEGLRRSPSARIEFEVRNGLVECVSVVITASASGRPIGNGDLNSLPDLRSLGASTVEDCAMRRLSTAALAGLGPGETTARVMIEPSALAERAALRRQIRQAPRTAQVEQAAAIYRQNIENAPTEAVAVALGVSRRTAARRLDEARAAGLLPKTTQGKRKA